MINCLSTCFSSEQADHGYTFHETIGSGSYGQVFRVSKEKIFYAMKCIKLLQDRNDVSRILREVQVLRAMSNCSSVAKLYDWWMDEEQEKIYLVLERFDFDLRVAVKLKLSEDHLRYIARQIFAGLAYLHSCGILHRDIKPANILTNANDCRTVLCDFNLARFDGYDDVHSPRTQNVVSRWYRAPELLCKNSYGKGVDIWAAGCVLAELALGKPMWSGNSDEDQLKKISATMMCSSKELRELGLSEDRVTQLRSSWLNADALPHISKEFTYFLRGLFRINSSHRYTALDALQDPWISTLNHPPVLLSTVELCEYALKTDCQKVAQLKSFCSRAPVVDSKGK